MLFKRINPREAFLSNMKEYLSYLPEQFVKIETNDELMTSLILITHPIKKKENVIFKTKHGLIEVKFDGFYKKYNCFQFNYKRQIVKASNEWIFLLKKPKLESFKPKMKMNQVAISICEPSTGIVLEVETLKKHMGWGDIYKVFETKDLADDYYNNRLNKFEAVFYNEKFEIIERKQCHI